MAEKYFPFNSVANDRVYKAEDFAGYFAQFIGNGIIYASSDALKVIASDGMNVILQAGGAFINGRGYINNTNLQFTLDIADGVLNRIDRLVLRCDFAARSITAKIKKGAYSAQPTAQVLQRDADIYELAIADIYVVKGAVSITQAAITDQRLNTELCGVVTGLIEQADTTEIFNQFSEYLNEFKSVNEADYENWYTTQQTDFAEWVNSIKDILSEAAAGNLQLQIDGVNEQLAAIEYQVPIILTTSGIQTLINSLPAYSKLKFSPKVSYTIDASLQLPSHITIDGGFGIDEEVKSTINFSGTGDLFIPNNSVNNILSIKICNLIMQGDGTNNGISMSSERLEIENCTFKNFVKGIKLTSIDGNVVENRINKCAFYYNNYGIYIDNLVGTNSDGFITNCIFKSSSVSDIYAKDFDGWIVEGNHFYSVSALSNIDVRGFLIRIVNNYFEQSVNHIKLKFTSSNLGTIIISNNLLINSADNCDSIIIDSNIDIDGIIISNNIFKSTVVTPSALNCVKGTGTGIKYPSILNNINTGYTNLGAGLPNAFILRHSNNLHTNSSLIEFLTQSNKIKFGVCYGDPATVLGNTPSGSFIVDYLNSKYYLSYGTGYRTLPFATTTINASVATDFAGLKSDYNTLIAALKSAKIIF